MSRKDKTICILAGIVAGVLIGTILIGATSEAKMVKEYLGKWYISTYSAASNTPSGTHATSSGAYATAGWTCAVDKSNPLVPMGSIIHIDGIGKRKVQDYGGFGRYNGGRRAIDVFVDGGGYLVERKIWLIRPETKKERKKRLRKERLKRQKATFTLIWDPSLLPWQIVTDRKTIRRGTVQIGYGWYEVVKSKKGLGNVIRTGDRTVLYGKRTKLGEVIENAVG